MPKARVVFAAVLGAEALGLSLQHGQPLVLAAQQPPAQIRELRADVEMLASDRFEGRPAGSNGERLAGAYLAGQLQKIGAKALPGQDDFFLPFEFTAGARDGGSWVSVEGKTYKTPGEVRALAFSDNGDANGPVVFAGYGLTVPEGSNAMAGAAAGGFGGYDSYAGLDVKDKIVLVLRYFPEDADQQTRAALARYADLRYKAMAARQHGARALLVATGPRSPNAGETIPMSFDTALAGSGIVAASISDAVANAILSPRSSTTGRGFPPRSSLEAAQRALDSGNPHVPGFVVPDLIVSVHTDVVREKQTARNVAAYLPATAPLDGVEKPWIIIGAHYDHLGRGGHGDSLAGKAEIGMIHPGADDNASGDAAVLDMGRALARQARRRHVMLVFWSAEELGLIGSNAFVAKPPVPLSDVEAYLNLDMVGRMKDNKLTVQATGTSPAWPAIIEQANVPAGFDLVIQQDPYQPTDVASFNLAGVPCLTFFTGTHADYHRPTDTADKIDYEDLGRIVNLAVAVTRKLEDASHAPQFTKVQEPGGAMSAGRAGVRVFTGTIPDYSTEVKGLLLSGVVGGGPAEQAGLQRGDTIIEIAGQSIANIYDYTYALEVLKVGEPVKVVYERGRERRETMMTPAARK